MPPDSPARVALVIGTRPEAIKLAPVVRALERFRPRIEPLVCATGQHRELLDQALVDMELKVHRNLHLMSERQELAALLARAIGGLDEVLREWQPSWCVVQGDTSSALAGALAAHLRGISVAHVEAGLRSGDLSEPFPEEANRRLIAQLAQLHFAPTARAARALQGESLASPRIHVTGNTVVDSLLWMLRRLPVPARESNGRRTVLVTLHRRESFGPALARICRGLLAIAVSRPDVRIVFPVHPSPRVRGPVREILGNHPAVDLCDPLPYSDFIATLASCFLVVTDSGGVQEEAPALGKPVLVVRNKTERDEGVRAGTAWLIGTNPRRILGSALKLLDDPDAYRRMAHATSPYGDGHAGERVAHALAADLGMYSRPPPAPFAPVDEKTIELV